MKRRTMLLGMGVAAGGGSMLGTGAFTSVEADRSASVAVAGDEDAFLRLAPCTDDNGNPLPNGEYVQPENGVLTLDLTGDNPTSGGGRGVNADATSQFDNVFEIQNQGTQPIGVWLETADAATAGDVDGDGNDEPRIEFYRADDPSTEIVDDGNSLNAKCLDVGESVCVGFIIRTQGLSSGDTEDQLFAGSPPTYPGSNDEELVVNADAEVGCGSGGGTPGTSGPAGSLYLTDTQDDPAQAPSNNEPFGSPSDDTSKLYKVAIDGNASLTELLNFNTEITAGPGGGSDFDGDGVGDYNHVVALAASADQGILYAIDKFSDRLGKYDLDTDTFTDLGAIENAPGGTLQAAVSPTDTLYVTAFGDTGFYEVDITTPSATRVATITDNNGDSLEAGGSDFAFAPDGTLYFVDAQSSPRVLYKVTDISSWSTTTTKVTTGEFGPGLAVLDSGNLIYSDADADPDELVEINPADGSTVATYPLVRGGSEFDHQFGDLAWTS